MLLSLLILAVSLVLILFGANYLVDGASDIARKSGLSELVIGLTIVGIGTSAPEMAISFVAAIEGNSDIAIGNIVGSNILNTALILGLSAFIAPMAISRGAMKRDIPCNMIVTLIMLVMAFDSTILSAGGPNMIGRIDGVILLLIFVLYLYLCFHFGNDDIAESGEAASDRKINLPRSIIYVLGGLVALVAGGRLFVNSASDIARAMGVSDAFIAVTIIALGTSLPELSTSVVAAVKGKSEIAVGNVLGSNIANILLILGGSALISPLEVKGITPVDIGMMTLCAFMILSSASFTSKGRFSRTEGAVLLILEMVYLSYLIISL